MSDTPDIGLVAVDIDGTFLRTDYTYDRRRFAALRKRLRNRDIRFVVASGNQYEQLYSHFDDAGEFAYVADNGAFVRDRDEQVFTARLDPASADRVIAVLAAHPDIPYLGSGPGCAWVPESSGVDYLERMRKYYPSIELVPSLSVVRDRLFKFCVDDPRGISSDLVAHLNAEVGDVIVPVTSGHFSLDMIIPGAHKAHGLQLLMDRWGIHPSRAAAFGDGNNDIEMLKLCGWSVAMANAPAAVQAAARYLTAPTTRTGC